MDQPRRFRVHAENGVTRIDWRWVGAHHALVVTRYYTVYALWRGPRKRRIAGDLRDENEAVWLATTLDRRFGYDRDLEKKEPPVEIRLR